MNEQPACVPYSRDVMVYCAEQRLQRFIEARAKEHSRAMRFQFSVARGSMAVRHVREDILRICVDTVLGHLVPSTTATTGRFATGGIFNTNIELLLQGIRK